MTASDTKKFNTLVGSLLILLGCILFGIAGYITLTPAPVKPAPVPTEPIIDKDSCKSAIMQLGYSLVSITDGDISVYEANLDNPEDQLRKSSLAIAMCKRLKLKSFCIGRECTKYGLSFTLKGSNDPKAATAKPAAAPAPAAKPAKSNAPKK